MNSQYRAFAQRASDSLAKQWPNCELEIVGSVARGKAKYPYSDLDLLLLTPEGQGPLVRDEMHSLVSAAGDPLTFFVDPFSHQGTFCSVFQGPLKVDWFVAEDVNGRRQDVWSGRRQPPRDPEGHPWDWIWWTWGKFRNGRMEFAAQELTKLWQFLVLEGADQRTFPPLVADPSGLVQLVRATLSKLPGQSRRVAQEVRGAIERDMRR